MDAQPGDLFIRVVFHDSESIAFGIITVLNISHTWYRNYRRENPAASFGNPLRAIIYRFNFDGVDSRVPLIVPGTESPLNPRIILATKDMPVGGVVFRPLNFSVENLRIESSSLLRIVGGNFEINHIWHGVIKPWSFLFDRLDSTTH